MVCHLITELWVGREVVHRWWRLHSSTARRPHDQRGPPRHQGGRWRAGQRCEPSAGRGCRVGVAAWAGGMHGRCGGAPARPPRHHLLRAPGPWHRTRRAAGSRGGSSAGGAGSGTMCWGGLDPAPHPRLSRAAGLPTGARTAQRTWYDLALSEVTMMRRSSIHCTPSAVQYSAPHALVRGKWNTWPRETKRICLRSKSPTQTMESACDRMATLVESGAGAKANAE